MKIIMIFFFLSTIQYISPPIDSSAFAKLSNPKQNSDTFSKNWIDVKSFGFPVQLALDKAINNRTRKIYVYIQAEDFTEDSIKKVFLSYIEKYQQTEFLDIYAYSNKEYLNKLIDAQSFCCLSFSPTPEGDKGLKQHLETIYPPPTGYYRAWYTCDPRESFLFFSPDPEKKEMIRLKLD